MNKLQLFVTKTKIFWTMSKAYSGYMNARLYFMGIRPLNQKRLYDEFGGSNRPYLRTIPIIVMMN